MWRLGSSTPSVPNCRQRTVLRVHREQHTPAQKSVSTEWNARGWCDSNDEDKRDASLVVGGIQI